jgi:polysaccharide pyruvyl transferase WcaK-like protein
MSERSERPDNDHVLIVNAYSYRNAGDAAIMLSTAHLMRDLGYQEVRLSTRYLEDEDDYARHGIPVLPPLIPFPARAIDGGLAGQVRRTATFGGSALGLIALLALPKPVRRSRRYRALLTRLFPETELLTGGAHAVIAGGGYLYSAKRLLNLSLLHSLLSIWVCSRLAERVVCMPNSVGPLDRRIDQQLVQFVLKDVDVVLREDLSIERSRNKPHLRTMRLVPDVAFYGLGGVEPGSGPGRARGQNRAPVVRIVAMDWSWSKSVAGEAMPRYVERLAAVGDALIAKGINVQIGGHSAIPEHGQEDLHVGRRVAAAMIGGAEVDEDCDVSHLEQAYANVDVVVGTRLHAAIMATAVGTPTVVLGYQEKAKGIVQLWMPETAAFSVDDFEPDAVVDAVVAALGGEARAATVELEHRLKDRIRAAYGG